MAGVVALLAATAACGGGSVEPTHVTGAQLTACRALVRALPARVSDQGPLTRLTDVPGATWGDPAVVLRCGVGQPADLTPTSACQTVDGVDWYVPPKATADQRADVVMTTIGRSPRIEVTLPARYRPPANAMVDLAGVITAHTRRTTGCS